MAIGLLSKDEAETLLAYIRNFYVHGGTITKSGSGQGASMTLQIDESDGDGGGTTIRWAKITAVTDANNYTVSVWSSRSSYVNGDDAEETSKQCRVPDIVDSLAVNDLIPVEEAEITGEDYICNQQLGLL